MLHSHIILIIRYLQIPVTVLLIQLRFLYAIHYYTQMPCPTSSPYFKPYIGNSGWHQS